MKQNTNNTIQTFWVALGSFSSFGLAIVSSAILSRYLDKTGYGTYKQILYVYSTLLIIFSAGLPKIFAYYLPRYSLDEGKAIVKKVSTVLFICGLAFSIFLFICSGLIAELLDNKELKQGLILFSPIPMLLLPTLGIEGIFSTYKKTVYIAVYNTITRLLMLLFIVGPVIIFNGTYIHAIYGWLTVSILTFIIAYFFKGIPFKNVKNVKTELRIKEILTYSLPLVLASIWGIAIKAADSFYISRFFGTEIFAEYSNGFIDLPFVTMITASVSIVLMPVFSKTFHEGNKFDELISTWRNTLKSSAVIIYPLIVYFFVFASDVIVTLFSEKYEASVIYFKINLIFNFFNIIIFAPLFLAMGKTKLYAKAHMILALYIWITGYLVILIFNSPVAIAINSTSTNVVKILVFVYITSRILKIDFIKFFPLKKMYLSFIQSILSILIVFLINTYLITAEILIFRLIITFLIYTIIILATSPLFGINYLVIIKPLFQKVLKTK